MGTGDAPTSTPGGAVSIQWQWAAFADLRASDVYALLALREAVFVVEQRCLFADLDWLDQKAMHLLGWQINQGQLALVAYLRALPPGLKYSECAIGRVVTARSVRGTGIGKVLMGEGLRRTGERYPRQPIRIGAQSRLERFYAGFGFVTASPPYDEDGIPHIEMLKSIS